MIGKRMMASLRRQLQWFTGVSCPVCLLAVIVTFALGSISIGAILLDRVRVQQQAAMMAKGVAEIARQRTTDLFVRIESTMRAVEDAAGTAPTAEGARGRIDQAIGLRRRAEPRLLALYLLDQNGALIGGSSSASLRSSAVVPTCLREDRPDADQVMLRPFSVEQQGGGTIRGLCFVRGLRHEGFSGSVLAVIAADLLQGQFADLSVGAHGAVVLMDENAWPLARIISGQPVSVDPRADRWNPNWEAGLRSSGIDPQTGTMFESRRLDGPFGAIVAVVIPPEDVLAAWFARTQLIGSSAFVVLMFVGLAVISVKTCERRERARLERLATLTMELRTANDTSALTQRLIEEACDLVECEVVPPEPHETDLGADRARAPELTMPRADRVRIGGQVLRRRDGAAFSAADLTYLTVLSRIGTIQLGQASLLAQTNAVAEEVRDAADRHRQNAEMILLEMPDATFTLDAQWRIVSTNRNADKLFGEYAEDVRGRVIWEVFPELEGTLFATECRRAVKDGHPVDFEMKWLRTETWLMAHAHPRAPGIVVYLQDISRQVATDDKLRQAAKMDAIGRLTGGIAHDFNNLLTVILGNTEMLDTELPQTGEVREMHDQIKRAAQNAAELTHQLLAFARRQPLSPSEVDVTRLATGLDSLLRRTLGASMSLEIRCAPGLWHARVDPMQLENAILNLAVNARDAIAPGRGGRLKIEAANIANRKPEVDQFGELRPGNYVVISVEDNGTGIPKDVLANVFEPFFTTKPSGRGTGLGLSMVYGFATQSGGHARIVSDEGRGTTVRLYLPALAESRSEPVPLAAPVASPAAGEPALATGRSEKILVVEDSEMVRSHAQAVLSALGYDVTAVSDGNEALALIDKGLKPDLLLTDILLPNGMDGLMVAEKVVSRVPGLPVLFMSGYVENVDMQKSKLDPQTNLLLKPFRRASLAAMVRARLETATLR